MQIYWVSFEQKINHFQLYSKLVNLHFSFSNLVNFVLFQGSKGEFSVPTKFFQVSCHFPWYLLKFSKFHDISRFSRCTLIFPGWVGTLIVWNFMWNPAKWWIQGMEVASQFFHFHALSFFLTNNRSAHPSGVGAPGKSWNRHCRNQQVEHSPTTLPLLVLHHSARFPLEVGIGSLLYLHVETVHVHQHHNPVSSHLSRRIFEVCKQDIFRVFKYLRISELV